MMGFVAVFEDGPAVDQCRQWGRIMDPPRNIYMAPIPGRDEGRWEMVAYTGSGTEGAATIKPFPSQVTYEICAVRLRTDSPEVVYRLVPGSESPDSESSQPRWPLVVDVVYKCPVYVRVELEEDLSGGAIRRVLKDEEAVERSHVENVNGDPRVPEDVAEAAISVAAEQTWPEWESGL